MLTDYPTPKKTLAIRKCFSPPPCCATIRDLVASVNSKAGSVVFMALGCDWLAVPHDRAEEESQLRGRWVCDIEVGAKRPLR